MPSIKFNLLTKEIEMMGPESFIESNFNKIQKLLVESLEMKEKMVTRKKAINQDSVSFATMKAPQEGGAETEKHQFQASQILSTTQSAIPTIAQDLSVKRPPVRKYIRKEGAPGNQRIVVEVVQKKTTEISISSLKEKFGLSESKIGGIIRDAEKLGKIRRVLGGSYSWT